MIFLMSEDAVKLLILGLAIIPIFALMLYAIIVALRRSSRINKQRQAEIDADVDTSQIEIFLDVYGGANNIKNVTIQMGRITVDVENLELVRTEELQELGASGVLLVGSSVKCSFGDRAPYIYKILNDGKKVNE